MQVLLKQRFCRGDRRAVSTRPTMSPETISRGGSGRPDWSPLQGSLFLHDLLGLTSVRSVNPCKTRKKIAG